jgi:hypothetical protein
MEIAASEFREAGAKAEPYFPHRYIGQSILFAIELQAIHS